MIIKKAVLSKKGLKEYQKKNRVCVFYVDPRANKFQIKSKIEEVFKVKVEKVRTSVEKPVLQNSGMLRKFPGKIKTKLRKKAFVELKEGEELPIFPEN
jgi:large subunit ribosomal protein L23